MPSGTLSQEEIDKLLGNAGVSSAPSQRHASPVEVQVYDFRRPNRISTERMRTLEAMFERLCKSLEAWLIGRVRKQVEFKLVGVEALSFGEFVLSLPLPCAAYGFDIINAPGQKGVIDIGHDFAYFIVDRLFGGAGTASSMTRALTPIERMTVKLVVERITALVTEIWQDHVNLPIDVTTFESVPEMVQAVSREQPVLVANIEFSGDGMSALIPICLPFEALERFFSNGEQQRVKPMAGTDDERRATREVAEGALRVTSVDVRARLPEFTVSFRDLMNLPVGGVIPTSLGSDTPIEVWVGGEPRFRGHPGRLGTKLAIRLIDEPTQ